MRACAVAGLTALLAACGPRSQAPAPPPPVRGPYHFVAVSSLGFAGRNTVAFRLSNEGAGAVCFLRATLPGYGRDAVRVFTSGGVERQQVEPAVDPDASVTAIQRLDAQTHLDVEARFRGRLRQGDCVLFEPIYEPCDVVHGDEIDASMGISAENLGVAQGVWRMRDGELTPIPDSEPSCRERSRLAGAQASGR